ncbi:helix-turn-helix domain-containing protein [Streptomyces sp. A7024]|uniref:Helix-turn-helix domain-containing protein n=1 Tax=Streptomyces coryli TaxID=1128680 RepID=A0A6G4UDJ8_9ACTN|nr:helix-turn-helix domain-containing protein [Streptomyces coryli]NGN69271.1 helix-turn-helix domain-containing protein [Streptomyces coryli]
MLNNVVCVLTHDVNAFEMGVICEVFGIDRSDQGLPVYDFATVAGEEPPIRLHPGMAVTPSHRGLDRIAEADLVAVPAGQQFISREFPEDLLEALRAAVDRGAYVLSVCTGAFLLGRAGLLDGRQCTTHWRHADDLARQYPRAELEPGVLYVQDGPVITSAGTASGIDACLSLVRQEQGSKVANTIARRMVVPPHRDGGQAQYIQRPVPERCGDDAIGEALAWMQDHLDQESTVEELAALVHLAPRTFARRFQQETGSTPYQWMLGQRVLHAQHLLEETDLTVDAIAARAGFGNAATLRHHFLRRLETTPNAYRRTFRGPQAVA